MRLERVIPVVVLVLVAAGVVLAFRVIGTPAHERDVTLDQIRSGGLAESAADINEKYSRKGLPITVTDSVLKRDPVTHEFYDYQRISRNEYVLCATFAAASTGDALSESANPYVRYPDLSAKFKHGVGHSCYSIDVTQESPEPHQINAHAPKTR